MTPKLRVLLIALTVSLTLDLLSKYLVDTCIDFAERITVIEGFFYLTHVRNPGGAFGLFADGDALWRQWFFISVSCLAIWIIISFFRQIAPGDRLSALALGLILGGAVGNLVDRVLREEVVDFLHFRLWGGYSWPDFNFADSFIVVGVAILLLELLASEGEKRAGTESGEPEA
ncbi:MAG: signal peptidase II [Myxococcales bacterium]|nr:signal peptidase II [Myxococcales bacterium]MDH5305879.1 signal peptidase II [Myxococcales bacterium]MDH5565339.1 signal peptidase II [Myxococcales bacterium]